MYLFCCFIDTLLVIKIVVAWIILIQAGSGEPYADHAAEFKQNHVISILRFFVRRHVMLEEDDKALAVYRYEPTRLYPSFSGK